MNCTCIVSVTSIVPFGETTICESNFSMRSSRAPAAETNIKKTARKRMAAYARLECLSGARFMRAALSLRRRRAGRVEANLGRFAFGGGGYFEELARLESQYVGKNVGRKLLNLGVEVAHDGVVVAPRVLHGVLDLGERILERSETFDGTELRVGLGKRKEALQRTGEDVFRLSLVAGAGRGHGAVARVDDRFERALFVARITFHGFHEIGDQVITPFKLNVDICPGVVGLDFQPHQAVVHPDPKNNEQNEEA